MAGAGSAAQLVTYSYIEELVSRHTQLRRGSWRSNLAGALLSGFVVAVVINPLDVVTTRLYNQPAQVAEFLSKFINIYTTHFIGNKCSLYKVYLFIQGRLYSSYIDCVVKIARAEGLPAFYKGLAAQYLRIGPHSFLSLLFWHHTRRMMGLLKS